MAPPNANRPPASKNKDSRSMDPQLRQRAEKLLRSRRELPIWKHADSIRAHLRTKDVLLLVGETGSGKSTQVPQFLLTEDWCRTKKLPVPMPDAFNPRRTSLVAVGGCIAVTEPRRVAAISLARRVAAEMGTPLGSASPSSQVGYSVRFDESTSPSTRIKFLTEGMLLQELLRDPWLRQYSAVVVDEIHERGVNVDLVAGFLRRMLEGKNEGRGGVGLKVVVMSATADMEGLRNFFSEAYQDEERMELENGRLTEAVEEQRRPVSDQTSKKETDADSASSWSGFSDSEDSANEQVKKGVKTKVSPSNASNKENGGPRNGHDHSTYIKDRIGLCTIKGRQYPVQIIYSPEPISDLIDGTLRTIFRIHHGEPMPGDILVFLTGQEDIEAVEKLVVEYAAQLKPGIPKMLVRPLFAALPQHVQQEAFLPAGSANTRKIILATNIAETSVTVSGVRYVVDGGKAKIKQFRTRLGLDSLLAKPISQSSALQRQGRAGREGEGKCYRLYTEKDYLTLEPSSTPEILRSDVTQTVLTIKARGVDDLTTFPFMTSPPREALERALLHLLTLGALSPTGETTDLGHRMAKLPLPPGLSRVLLAAAEPDMNCLTEVIDIISALTVENIFLNLTSEEKREAAEEARKGLLRREGDHLTLLHTVRKYLAEGNDRKAWTTQHFVSHRAMKAVTDVRKQLLAQCHRQKLLLSATTTNSTVDPSNTVTPDRADTILRCFLRGFASKTARLCPDGSYRTMMGNHPIAIHPSSTLFGKRVEAIIYNEYVFTNKSYAKGVSAVRLDWVGEAMGV